MSCASARCSRASGPFSTEKRAPAIFAAASKSSMPSAAPDVDVVLRPENRRCAACRPGALRVVLRGFAGGHRRVRQVRHHLQEVGKASTARRRASARALSAASAWAVTCAISADASSPFDFAWPICLESWLRAPAGPVSRSVSFCVRARALRTRRRRACTDDLRAVAPCRRDRSVRPVNRSSCPLWRWSRRAPRCARSKRRARIIAARFFH